MVVAFLVLGILVLAMAPLSAFVFRALAGLEGQRTPQLDHDGLRWTLVGTHLDRWTAAAGAGGAVMAVATVFWLGWILAWTAHVEWVDFARHDPHFPAPDPSWMDPWLVGGWYTLLLLLPGVLALLPLLGGLWALVRARTRRRVVHADADGLRIAGWRIAERIAWRDLTGVSAGRGALELAFAGSTLVLPAPGVPQDDLELVATWIRATRDREPEPGRLAPPPEALLRLRQTQ